ncbi:hypothetical protein [Paenibacillus crassostreae]|uniref:Uncharacterized protein n=1 Tax=Paenibacillus crassostreae TaxID=1763538 RepID=A0A167C5Y6_9BACL|nr:hypothetical protein [Paenibacillus crassostreae]AOZ91606.1 hypothetical protein LPB68_04830 [Paenibacillus crassostreae]OAB72819.1 hypothetical protein PNBC_15420 [Paenibacillus crassostreae]
MDIKTLEYMGNRVDKARDITKEIKALESRKHNISIHDVNGITVDGSVIGSKFRWFGSEACVNKRVVQAMTKAILVVIDEQIALLEQELAEL